MLANAHLHIDLDAIAENYERLSSRTGAAEVAAVIKADAYGLGAMRLAPVLAEAGARSFFVAQAGEGVALREALPAARIFVLNAPDVGASLYADNRLIPVLNNDRDVACWAAHGTGTAVLNIDTGMTRLGLADRTFEADRYRKLPLELVMSHLACADEPGHPQNAAQLERFQALRPLFPEVPASFANSPGLFLGPDYHFDMVRPGMALYGLNPTPGRPNPMRPAVELYARLLQIRELDRTESVGYGAAAEAISGRKLVTIGVGYADGFFRSAYPKARVFIEDYALPLVGRVSMDLIVADATEVPDALLQPGRWVEILGAHQSADQLAGAAGTIGYEVLTALGARLTRHYTHAQAGHIAAQ